ncbi:AhpD-like [Lasallia pustulata]|uniref:AhpD-like n=1 Tax=Lasallia pustulata TaxID=136370 RepID=A0A1W5CS61_9LECA|nr:AhpD-like [Lasallia pustulata]
MLRWAFHCHIKSRSLPPRYRLNLFPASHIYLLPKAMSSHNPPSPSVPEPQKGNPVGAALQEGPAPEPSFPSKNSLPALFTRIRAKFPGSLGSDTWCLVVASALISLSHPSCISDLYQHLTSQSQYQTSEQRMKLSKRLRDLLLKTWTLVGIPPVVSAFAALAEVEREGDVDETFEQNHQQLDADLSQRGEAFMLSIYRHNLDPILSRFGSHRPAFEWLQKSIIYGLFLSDHTELSDSAVLNAIETELITLSAIMCRQSEGEGGGRHPTMWHMRGSLRIGVGKSDLARVVECVELVAEWADKDTSGWVQVEDVESEV